MAEKTVFSEVILLTKTRELQEFKDWLRWHMDIMQFDRCHVFDNDSLVDIKNACDAYDGRVTYESIHGYPDQYNLYNRYINKESPAHWVLPIDDDEFLYVHDGITVNEYIKNKMAEIDHKNINRTKPFRLKKISVLWKNLVPYDMAVVNSDCVRNSVYTCRDFFEKYCPGCGDRKVKTLVNTGSRVNYCFNGKNERIKNCSHNPLLNDMAYPAILDDNTLITGDTANHFVNDEKITLFHYQFKSIERLKLKYMSSRADAQQDRAKALANMETIFSHLKDFTKTKTTVIADKLRG